MDKVILSTMGQSATPRDPNSLFVILDLKKETIEPIILDKKFNSVEITHGMGMDYCGKDLFVAGIIPPQRLRCASFLLIINLTNGERYLHVLNFVKAVHGLKALDNCRIIANSTQTDLLADITMYKGHLNEDILYDFRDERNLESIYTCFMAKNKNIPNWRVNPLDDSYHINGIFIHHNKIYVTMFGAFDKKHYGDKFNGIVYNLTDDKVVLKNLYQPHTPYVDSKGQVCCADSANFRFLCKNGKKTHVVELDGYTRGICEDPARKGYWVGVSAYRKYSKTQNKWVEIHRGNKPLGGARIQFIGNDYTVKRTIDLAKHGIKEVFDILPCLNGRWNG